MDECKAMPVPQLQHGPVRGLQLRPRPPAGSLRASTRPRWEHGLPLGLMLAQTCRGGGEEEEEEEEKTQRRWSG